MTEPTRQSAPGSAALAGPGMMILSAAIFGYFGFMTMFPEIDSTTGKVIPLVVTLKWTLRVSAVAFFAAALATVAKPVAGNLLYAGLGVVSAIALAVVGVWDLTSTYYSGIHPFLLFLFAAWNGYSSWSSLRVLLRYRAASGSVGGDSGERPFAPPESRGR
jgi:hypothetical protein